MKFLPGTREIKNLRKKLNINQKELGKKLRIPQSTISRIENRRIDPPYSKFKKIYEFLQNERIKRESIGARTSAEHIMSKNLLTINSKSSIKDAINLLNEYSISQVPIIESGQNMGSLTSKKIQKFITDNPEIINADVSTIKELPFPEIEKNWNVKEISNLLINYPAVLVRERNIYVGIITDSDLLKLTNEN
ncbi:MAG TPA: CBS domain-containing protein [bacterium]|nr:CBS domain-containing protein [bacterium]